jgi:RND family efflux transporter MFP subunit
VTEYLEFTGTTAVRDIEVQSRVTGHILEVRFGDGAVVHEGDLLYLLDPAPFEAALQRAQADLSRAQVELEVAAQEHERYEGLFNTGVVSDSEYDTVRGAWLAAGETVAAAEAVVSDAEFNLGHTQIQASGSGRVGESLTVGSLVNAGSTVLAVITPYDPMYVYFNVSERELLEARESARQREGTTDEEAIYPIEMGLLNDEGYPFSGVIDFADLGVDPESGTFQLRAIIDNPENRILPGQFAKVRIPTETLEGSLLVPERALGLDQTGRYLLTVDSQEIVHRQSVTVGTVSDGMAVITEGIGPDDLIVVNGIQRARPGSPVTPQRTDSQPEG